MMLRTPRTNATRQMLARSMALLSFFDTFSGWGTNMARDNDCAMTLNLYIYRFICRIEKSAEFQRHDLPLELVRVP